MTYNELWRRLTPTYSDGEAKAIVRRVLETRFGLSVADIYCGRVAELNDQEAKELDSMMNRLAKAEPVQYVLGEETFAGRTFKVNPSVLIPRPETEELCSLIVDDCRHTPFSNTSSCDNVAPLPITILDIGTGSGCIAITLALDIAAAEVTAWDISLQALATARHNAKTLKAHVSFEERDALCPPADTELWDVIVSNPPYICHKEKAAMERNVLDHEPHLALFVPDNDPLLFYRAIAFYGLTALKKGGRLWFEVNAAYAADTAAMLADMGYADLNIVNDFFGSGRFIKATRP